MQRHHEEFEHKGDFGRSGGVGFDGGEECVEVVVSEGPVSSILTSASDKRDLQVSQLAHVGQALVSSSTLAGMLQHLRLLAVFEDFVCQRVGNQ